MLSNARASVYSSLHRNYKKELFSLAFALTTGELLQLLFPCMLNQLDIHWLISFQFPHKDYE